MFSSVESRSSCHRMKGHRKGQLLFPSLHRTLPEHLSAAGTSVNWFHPNFCHGKSLFFWDHRTSLSVLSCGHHRNYGPASSKKSCLMKHGLHISWQYHRLLLESWQDSSKVLVSSGPWRKWPFSDQSLRLSSLPSATYRDEECPCIVTEMHSWKLSTDAFTMGSKRPQKFQLFPLSLPD